MRDASSEGDGALEPVESVAVRVTVDVPDGLWMA
jgi:hypothetical protein